MHERELRKLMGWVLGGRYRLEHVLSSSENQALFRANDTRLGRAVTVKVARGSLTREARNTAVLPHHPNVRPAFDYGTDEVLQLDYVVLEFLDGMALSSALEHIRQPMSIDPVARILKEISAGLAVLHKTGVVHCRLDPSHVFLERYQRGEDIGDECSVRLVGLGGSQTLWDDEVESAPLPRERDYVAPEQLRGGIVTPATDIYGCGLIGLQLIGGSPRKVNAAGEAPAERELERVARFRPELPQWLLTILSRCLRSDPRARYDCASQLRDCIERKNADLYPERTFTPAPLMSRSEAGASATPPSWTDILQLKPNVWGIGLDLEALWRRWRWNQDQDRS